jgi:hypothetical protein
MGRIGGHCAARHPDLAPAILSELANINMKSQKFQQQTEEIATRAFERAFPGQGTSKLYQQEEWDADQELKKTNLSRDTCTSISSALEAMADDDDPSESVWIFVNNLGFRTARLKLPQCG